MNQHIDNGSLHFIEVLDRVQPAGSLRPLFDVVQTDLQATSGGNASVLVILDDISSLEWFGFSSTEISRFLRALCATCRKVSDEMSLWAFPHHLRRRELLSPSVIT